MSKIKIWQLLVAITILCAIHLFLVLRCNAQNPCLQVDIMLVGDFSGSVSGHEKYIKQSFSEFTNQFDLSEETVKIGVVSFASTAVLDCPLTTDKEQIHKTVGYIYHFGGSTNMHTGLQWAVNELLDHGRPGFRKVIILVSDGVPDYPAGVEEISEQLHLLNISLYGMLINTPSHDAAFMELISHKYLESDYESLSEEIRKLDICL